MFTNNDNNFSTWDVEKYVDNKKQSNVEEM